MGCTVRNSMLKALASVSTSSARGIKRLRNGNTFKTAPVATNKKSRGAAVTGKNAKTKQLQQEQQQPSKRPRLEVSSTARKGNTSRAAGPVDKNRMQAGTTTDSVNTNGEGNVNMVERRHSTKQMHEDVPTLSEVQVPSIVTLPSSSPSPSPAVSLTRTAAAAAASRRRTSDDCKGGKGDNTRECVADAASPPAATTAAAAAAAAGPSLPQKKQQKQQQQQSFPFSHSSSGDRAHPVDNTTTTKTKTPTTITTTAKATSTPTAESSPTMTALRAIREVFEEISRQHRRRCPLCSPATRPTWFSSATVREVIEEEKEEETRGKNGSKLTVRKGGNSSTKNGRKGTAGGGNENTAHAHTHTHESQQEAEEEEKEYRRRLRDGMEEFLAEVRRRRQHVEDTCPTLVQLYSPAAAGGGRGGNGRNALPHKSSSVSLNSNNNNNGARRGWAYTLKTNRLGSAVVDACNTQVGGISYLEALLLGL